MYIVDVRALATGLTGWAAHLSATISAYVPTDGSASPDLGAIVPAASWLRHSHTPEEQVVDVLAWAAHVHRHVARTGDDPALSAIRHQAHELLVAAGGSPAAA